MLSCNDWDSPAGRWSNRKQCISRNIEHILTDLPPPIDTHILDGPHILEGIPENPGYTGIEVIDNSQISIRSEKQDHQHRYIAVKHSA